MVHARHLSPAVEGPISTSRAYQTLSRTPNPRLGRLRRPYESSGAGRLDDKHDSPTAEPGAGRGIPGTRSPPVGLAKAAGVRADHALHRSAASSSARRERFDLVRVGLSSDASGARACVSQIRWLTRSGESEILCSGCLCRGIEGHCSIGHGSPAAAPRALPAAVKGAVTVACGTLPRVPPRRGSRLPWFPGCERRGSDPGGSSRSRVTGAGHEPAAASDRNRRGQARR